MAYAWFGVTAVRTGGGTRVRVFTRVKKVFFLMQNVKHANCDYRIPYYVPESPVWQLQYSARLMWYEALLHLEKVSRGCTNCNVRGAMTMGAGDTIV